ncbi:MAG: 30S ribosomal protein S12 methylthiotransferase RimO [Muribaculaceae bacterium]|nr:30S ribosomal protein S12 methylthiotransferase RimO [Muribaculaceae bacterium]
MSRRPTVDVISLGCSKNLVDSERLLAMFGRSGIDARLAETPGERKADAVVINTCGFIGDAKEESINTILEAAGAKDAGRVGKVVVMGCLSERYSGELPAELPEVDAWYGKFDWPEIVKLMAREHPAVTDYDRVITTPRHHAYLKISEGCNRFCAFCAIPLITGRMHSRPIEEIEAEVKALTRRGVREFNIIAQDLSSYGLDLEGHRHRLPELVERLADISGVDWLRLHYAYPSDFPYGILPVMASRDNVCSYLDIALQHISDRVLENMRRHITGAQTRELIARMREEVPDLHLRTTLMVGFPGEGEREFDELMEFVKQTRFERMGAFAYCEEEDTYAARNFKDLIPQEEKQRRLDALMALQEKISLEQQEAKVGKTLRVMIDREESEFYVGRTQWDSPEVDPEVLVRKTMPLKPGVFADVTVESAMPFELIAVPAGEASFIQS